MKSIRLLCSLLIVQTLALGQSAPISIQKTGTVKFIWKGDSLNHQWEPYAAILLPVKLPGSTLTWYMQFDTGSPTSLFYRNPLAEIQQKYPRIKGITDSVNQYSGQFTIGNITIAAHNMPVKDFGGKLKEMSSNNINIIGTIGTDLIDGKSILIDYPATTITISDSLPAAVATHDLMYIQKRILLPAIIQNKNTLLYFDSGSSSFELLTNQRTSEKLSGSAAPTVRYPVQSWDKTMYANTTPCQDSIGMASLYLPLHNVTWMEGASAAQINQMINMGMGGMIGNKLFIHHILVLDTRNKKFSVLTTSTLK